MVVSYGIQIRPIYDDKPFKLKPGYGEIDWMEILNKSRNIYTEK